MYVVVAVLAVLGVVAAVLVGAAVSMARGGRRSHDSGHGTGGSDERQWVSREEAAELEACWDHVDGEVGPVRTALIERRLVPLMARRVPVAVVEAAPELGATTIRFADGTAFVGRGARAGDAGVLAAVVRSHAVCISRCEHDRVGTFVVFGWVGARREISMLLTGLEQAA